MTTMSFLEHLEELRKRLIISVIAVVIGMGIAWPLVPTVQKDHHPAPERAFHHPEMALCPWNPWCCRNSPMSAKSFGLERRSRPRSTPIS